jgi:geranylgeranyl diphosphate synthase, type I
MEKIFLNYKKCLDKELKTIAKEIEVINLPWAKEFSSSLLKSAVAGKGVRGSLVLLILDLFKKPISKEEIRVAASLEYLHTALLIQDDIMDHDDKRRGLDTVHIEYKKIGKNLKVADPVDFGKSMAICIADVGIFSAYLSLNQLNNIDLKTKNSLYSIINKEFLLVGFGQAQDLSFSHIKRIPSVKQVLQMYNYKTARYTFSLPFLIGATLAKQSKETCKYLEKIGLSLGLIYQLTDDALTLSGDSLKVGKEIGNDIAENKKTLYHVLLKERASRKDYKIIDNVFGKKPVLKKDIIFIKDLISFYRVDREIDNLIIKEERKAKQEIAKLKIDLLAKEKLFNLVESLKNRKK